MTFLNIVIILCFVIGFIAALATIFSVPGAVVIQGLFWSFPAGWGAGRAFVELRDQSWEA